MLSIKDCSICAVHHANRNTPQSIHKCTLQLGTIKADHNTFCPALIKAGLSLQTKLPQHETSDAGLLAHTPTPRLNVSPTRTLLGKQRERFRGLTTDFTLRECSKRSIHQIQLLCEDPNKREEGNLTFCGHFSSGVPHPPSSETLLLVCY